MTFSKDELDLLAGCLDFAAKHVAAQLTQAGVQAIPEALGKLSAVHALAARIAEEKPEDAA